MKLYVGNLPYSTTGEELQSAFGSFGEVVSANVVQDRDSGRSRGFGFVEMPNAEEANSAIEAMNGKDFNGRNLVVNEARPRPEGGGPRGGGGGGFRRR